MTWEPPELDTLQDNTRMIHELYVSLVNEGFTEHQAMHIILGQPCCQLTHKEEE